MDEIVRTSACRCGLVRLQAVGKPILTGVCYCDDCQSGGLQIEALPGAPAVMDADGGTPYLTYRDDRLSCIAGAEHLKAYKLKDKAPTKRYVASCCNSGMYLKFRPGHWSSAYRARFDGNLPAIDMRTQTRFRRAGTAIQQDAPSYRRYPLKLFGKLIGARIAMFFAR